MLVLPLLQDLPLDKLRMATVPHKFKNHTNVFLRCKCGGEISGGYQVDNSLCTAPCSSGYSSAYTCGGQDASSNTVRSIYVNTHLMGCYQPKPPGTGPGVAYVPPAGLTQYDNSGVTNTPTNVYKVSAFGTPLAATGTSVAPQVASLIPVTWQTTLTGWSFVGCFSETGANVIIIRAANNAITGYPTLDTPGTLPNNQNHMTADYCMNYCQSHDMTYAALKFGK